MGRQRVSDVWNDREQLLEKEITQIIDKNPKKNAKFEMGKIGETASIAVR